MSNLKAVVVTVTFFSALNLYAQERKISRSSLPPAVEKTVVIQSRGATIRGFSTETEKGRVEYEAELLVDGHSKDVLIDSNGEILEVEEQVSIDSLPASVKAGLQAKAGAGRLVKVESITKHDKLVAYEAQVKTGVRRSEVQTGPDGESLDHEE